MQNQHALRYLLLRYFQAFKSSVPRKDFLEVTKNLKVTADRSSYTITWKLKGEEKTKVVSRNEFSFYTRGDTKPETRSIQDNLKNKNDERAISFVKEVLNISPSLEVNPSISFSNESYLIYNIIANILFVWTIMFFGNIGIQNSFLLLGLLLIEYVRGGRLYVSVLFLIFAVFSGHGGIFFGAAAYGCLQFLDPDRVQRPLRVILSVGASAIVLLMSLFGWGVTLHFSLIFWTLTLLAFIVAMMRSLISIHFRAMPLALPFFCVGLALNSQITTAILGLVLCVIYIIIESQLHHWWPVQRERELTPNG